MIPFFELILTELGGVECISLVDRPAMESTWIKLSKQEVKFQTVNTEKRILFGAILIPNKPIYRMSEDGQEFYIVFSKDTIEKVRNKYFATQKNLEFNAQHEAHIKVNGYMVESFIKDSSRGMNPPQQFMDLPDGTWFGSIKVEDDVIWNRFITNNVFTGFSIEGDFKTKPIMDMAILDKFQAYLDSLNQIKKLKFYNENHGDDGRFAPSDGSESGGYDNANFELPRTLDKAQGEKLASLAGIPKDFDGKISFEKGFGSKSTNVYLENDNLKMHRTINENDMTIKNNYIIVKDKYSGTKIFNEQVNQAAKDGYSKITCKSVRDVDANGYYTWPRLGYKPVNEPTEHIAEFNKQYGVNAKSLGDMMKTQQGRDYWKKNGVGLDLVFDLKEGSYSRKTLAAYHKEKFGK